MKTKDIALRIGGAIFGVVSLIHIIRLIVQLPVHFGKWSLPYWVNIVGSLVTAALCIWFWRLSCGSDDV